MNSIQIQIDHRNDLQRLHYEATEKLILMVHLIVMAWASNFTKEILMSFKKILMTSMSPSRRNVKVKTRETQAVMEENDTRA